MTATTTPPLTDRAALVAHLVDRHHSTTAHDLSLLGARLAHAAAHQGGRCDHDHDRPRSR